MSQDPGAAAPAEDPRVLVSVAETLPELTGPNAALAVIREIRSGSWDRQHAVKQLLKDLHDEDINAFKTSKGEATPTSWILEAGRDLSRTPDLDPTEASLNAWLKNADSGVQVGSFARGEKRRRGYEYPAHDAGDLIRAQVQLDTLRELTALGVHADPVAALRANPAQMGVAQAAMERLRTDNPELNVDKAEAFAQTRIAYQDAKVDRGQKGREFAAQVKGSAHTKSALALGGVAAPGAVGLDAATDLSTPAAILVGVGLPTAYAAVDKVLNRDPEAPKPVRDAGRAYAASLGATGTAKHEMKDAERALKNSFQPPKAPSRSR